MSKNSASSDRCQSSPTVVVVEDSKGVRRAYAEILEREGIHAQSFSTAEAALVWLESASADLFIIDYYLPGMNGDAFVDELARRGISIPFIVATCRSDAHLAVQMMKRGAADFLIKDANLHDLFPVVVRRALAQAEDARRLAAAEEAHLAQAALRLSERNLTDFFNTATIGLHWVGPDGTILRANRADYELLGYTAEEYVGHNITEFHADAETISDILARLQRNETLRDHPARLRHKDGSVRHVLIDSSVLWEDGKFTHTRCFKRDVTERRRLEREVITSTEAERRRLGGELHDGLCQHLAGTALLAESLGDAVAHRSKALADQAVELARLLRESVQIARQMARGLSPVLLEEHGLSTALEELALNTESLFRVPCVFGCPKPVALHDHDAATHVFRIAQEAVSNALKHGQARRIEINLAAEGPRARLRVAHEGVGFVAPAAGHRGMGLRLMEYRAGVIDGALEFERHREDGGAVVCTFKRDK